MLSLRPGEYQYKLVVDNNWILDPANNFTAKDEKGNNNSLLKVGTIIDSSQTKGEQS